MNKKITLIILFTALVLVLAVIFFRFSISSPELLWNWSDGGRWLLPLVTVAALVDSINPCAFSVLLLTIAFLLSIGRLREKIVAVGLSYILGIFIVYILIGLGILQALHFFAVPNFMAKVGASLLVALGLINIINELFPAFPIKLKIPMLAHHQIASLIEKGSVPTAFFLGAFVALCEFPCTGGPYLMILGLLHDQKTYLSGLSYLIFYNLIFVLPLAVILLLAGSRPVLDKIQIWQKENRNRLHLGAGVAMVVLGVIIFLL